jgi:hypothetical protein
MRCYFRLTDNALGRVLLHLFDLPEDIVLRRLRVEWLLFYFWRGIIIIFQKRTDTEI